VDDATRVLLEVGRVLAAGGVYLLSTVHPTTIRLYGGWTGSGWAPRITYFDESPIPPDPGGWELDGRQIVAPTLEFGHLFETIINGMIAGGLVVDGLWEMRREVLVPWRARKDQASSGSDAHLESIFPAYIQVRGRKPPL
jgi:hypothetical protein